MLRVLLHNKTANIASGKALSRTLFNLNKASFSNSLLEDGEYIEGDFDVEAFGLDANANRNSKGYEFKKKYVNFENFGHNLTRQTPKPAGSYQKEIENSVQSLKNKFNFEISKDDEFAKDLQTRHKSKHHVKEQKFENLAEDRKTYSNMIKETLEKLYKNRSSQDFSKNLIKIETTTRTQEIMSDPVQSHMNNTAKQLADAQIQTAHELENYMRGQEGVDYITPGEDPTKTMRNLQAEIISDIYNLRSSNKIKPRGDKLNEWKIRKQHSIPNLVVTEDPVPYPGSSKGPHPRDDPEFFTEWLSTHMPDSHKKFYANLVNKIKTSRTKVGDVEPRRLQMENILDSPVANTDIGLTRAIQESLYQKEAPLEFSSKIEGDNAEVSPFIEKVTKDYQNSQEEIEKWTMFRMYPIFNNWTKNIMRLASETEKMNKGGKDPVLPSLYRYYNLLPEFARNNPIIINLVRAFEFTKHEMSLKEKEIALNYACQFCLPMEADLESAVKEAVISQKYFVPLWEENLLLDENRDLKKDDSELPGEKRKKLAGPVRSIEDYFNLDRDSKDEKVEIPEEYKTEGDWEAPPRLDPYIPEEDPYPILPLEYYDNDDGFWDEYIAAKEEKYNELPMIVNRPFFKH